MQLGEAGSYCKTRPLDWLEITQVSATLCQALRLRSKETIEQCLIQMLEFNFSIANKYDINLDNAWNRWVDKAKNKKYTNQQ